LARTISVRSQPNSQPISIAIPRGPLPVLTGTLLWRSGFNSPPIINSAPIAKTARTMSVSCFCVYRMSVSCFLACFLALFLGLAHRTPACPQDVCVLFLGPPHNVCVLFLCLQDVCVLFLGLSLGLVSWPRSPHPSLPAGCLCLVSWP